VFPEENWSAMWPGVWPGGVDDLEPVDQPVAGGDELPPGPERPEVFLRAGDGPGAGFRGDAGGGEVGSGTGPELEFPSVDEVPGAAEDRGLRIRVEESTEVVPVGVGEDDGGDLLGLHPDGGEPLAEFAVGRAIERAAAGVDEDEFGAHAYEQDVEGD